MGNYQKRSCVMHTYVSHMTSYLLLNKGYWPGSQTQFVGQGFLRIKDTVNGSIYEIYSGDEWRGYYGLIKNIKINYGINIKNIEKTDDMLVDKNSGHPILLFQFEKDEDALTHGSYYMNHSVSFYDLMIELRSSSPLPPEILLGMGNFTPLHQASVEGDFMLVKSLINQGADVNAKDMGLFTPLHAGATHGHKEVVEYLIEKGADVNAKDTGGFAPLHVAAVTGQSEIAEILIKNGALINDTINTNFTTHQGETAEMLAERYVHTEVAEVIHKYSTN